MNIHEIKTLARKEARSRRKAAVTPDAAASAAHVFFENIVLNQDDTVSLYRAIQSELDPKPLVEALWQRGIAVCLPVIIAPGKPLIFKNYTSSTNFVPGGFGTEVPDSSEPDLTPSLVIAPLLSFDSAGYRLGYGGGFYDRTLEGLRKQRPTRAYGYAYAAQEVEAVPIEATDQRLDGFVTEAGLIEVQG